MRKLSLLSQGSLKEGFGKGLKVEWSVQLVYSVEEGQLKPLEKVEKRGQVEIWGT